MKYRYILREIYFCASASSVTLCCIVRQVLFSSTFLSTVITFFFCSALPLSLLYFLAAVKLVYFSISVTIFCRLDKTTCISSLYKIHTCNTALSYFLTSKILYPKIFNDTRFNLFLEILSDSLHDYKNNCWRLHDCKKYIME